MKKTILRTFLWLTALTLLAALLGGGALAEDRVQLYGFHTLAPYAVAGEDLEVSLPGASAALNYRISFRDTNDYWAAVKTVTGTYDSRERTIVPVPTEGIAAGLWNVRVELLDANDEYVYRRSGVTNVVASAPSGTGLQFIVSETAREAGQATKIWAYAPGAVGVSVNTNVDYVTDSQGDCCAFAWIFDSAEDVTFAATAIYPDGTTASAAPVTVTVTGSQPTFEFEPTISEITDADGLNISFDKVTDGDRNICYDVYVEGMTDGFWDSWTYKNALEAGDADERNVFVIGDTAEVNIPSNKLTPGAAYYVSVQVYGQGLVPRAVERRLIYRQAAASQDVTVAVNGSTAAAQSVQVRESYFLRVNFPTNATAVRVFDGNEFEYLNYQENGWQILRQGSWTVRREDYAPNTRLIYAQFTSQEIGPDTNLEDLEWTATSDAIQLEAVSDGELAAAAEVTLSAGSVAQGEPLQVGVTGFDENNSLVWLSVNRAGDYDEIVNTCIYKSQTSAVIPTAGMEPGLYRLNISCVAEGQGHLERNQHLYFIVTDPTDPHWDDGFVFSVSPDTGVLAHEPLAVSARKPGAKCIRLRGLNSRGVIDQYGYWRGDSISGTFNLNADRYTLWVDAYMGESDEPWTDSDNWVSSDPLTMEIGTQPRDWSYSIVGADIFRKGNNSGDYTFYVTNLDKAGWWWDVRVNKMNPNGDWEEIWRCTADNRTPADADHPFVIPANALEPGYSYEITAWGDTLFCGGESTARNFFVTEGESTQSILLQAHIDGTTYGADAGNNPVDAVIEGFTSGEFLNLEIFAPGATGVRIFNQHHWEFVNNFRNGHGEYTVRPDENPGMFFVNACYSDKETDRWEDMEWSNAVSNIIKVYTVYLDETEMTDATVTVAGLDENDTARRGDLLNVTITDADLRAKDFCAFFRGLNGNEYHNAEWRQEDCEQPVSFTISTAELPAGEDYWLVVESGCPGYKWGSTLAKRFRVEEPENLGEDGMVFALYGLDAVEGDEADYRAYCDHEFRISAYAPGADCIVVTWQKEDDENNSETRFYGGNWVEDDWREGGDGLYQIGAVAYDEEDNVVAQHAGYTVSIESRGRLIDPEIIADGVFDLSGTAEACSVSVKNLDQPGCEWWHFKVFDTDSQDGEDHWLLVTEENPDNSNRVIGETTVFEIPKSLLQAGHRYEIEVWANGDGYEGSQAEMYFYVCNGVDNGIELTVNGGTAPVTGVTHVNEGEGAVNVQIHAPGAAAIRLWKGDSWDYYNDISQDGTLTRDGMWFDPGEYTLFAQATYQDQNTINWNNFRWEELQWSGAVSNQVQVTVTSDGIAAPAVLDKEAYTVTRGQFLDFTITGAGSGATRGTNFHAYIVDEHWNWDWNNDIDIHSVDANDFPVSGSLYTGGLKANEQYWLVVDSCAPRYDWNKVRIPLTVQEPAEGTVVFEVSQPVYRNEDFTLSGCAPGANEMRVEVERLDRHADDMEWGPWNGDHIDGRNMRLDEGEYQLTAVAYYDNGTTLRSAPVVVNVQTRGDMPQPYFAPAPDNPANANAELRFGIADMHVMDDVWYDVRLHDNDRNDYVNSENDNSLVWRATPDGAPEGTDNGVENGVHWFTIPQGTLTAGHSYSVDVWVDHSGYRGADAQAKFYACSGIDENIELKVNGGTTPTTGVAHVSEGNGAVNVQIQAPGAAAIRLWKGDHWDYYNDISQDGTLTRNGDWYDSGEYTLFAQATYQNQDTIDWDNFRWEELQWSSAVSNQVQLNVSSDGIAAPAVLDKEAYEVIRGELLHFEITGAGSGATRGTNFYAFIEDENGNWDWNNDINLYAGNEGDFPLSGCLYTGNLDANRQHWLVVNSSAPRYDWNKVRIPLTVQEPGADTVVFEVSQPVYRNENFTLSGCAPGADRMTVEVHRLDRHADDMEWGPWNGDHIDGRNMRLDEGEYRLTAVAYYVDEDDNETTLRSAPVVVNVQTRGDVPQPYFACTPMNPADVSITHIFGIADMHVMDDVWYDVRLHDNDRHDYVNEENDNSLVWRATPDGAPEGTDNGVDNDGVHWFTIPQGMLTAGHSYSVDVWVDHSGYRGASVQTKFYAFDGTTDSGVQISIDKANLWTAEETTVHVTAPVGTTALRIWEGDHWSYRNEVDPNTGEFESVWCWDDPAEIKMFASATRQAVDWDNVDWGTFRWENLSWGGVSNVLDVNIQSHGESTGELTVTPLNLEGGLTRGESAMLQINCTGHVDPVEIGNRVDVSIRNANNDIMDNSFRRYENVTFPFTVGIPTADIEAGRYHVVVSVCGVGYRWVETWTEGTDDDEQFWFDLTDPQGGITFGVDKTTAMVGEDVRFSLYAPGAAETRLMLVKNNDEDHPVIDRFFDRDRVSDQFSCWSDSGEMTLVAFARYPGDEDWQRCDPIDVIHMTFNMKGALASVPQEWETIVWKGSAPGFRFTPVDNAEWYNVGVVDPERGWLNEYSMQIDLGDVPEEGTWTSLRNGRNLEAGKVYIVGVDAFARGYTIGGSQNSPRIAVVDPDRVLYLPDGLKTIEDEAFAGVNAQMIVLPDGVESVGSRAFADCSNLVAVVSPIPLPGDAFQGCRWEVIVSDDTPAGE